MIAITRWITESLYVFIITPLYIGTTPPHISFSYFFCWEKKTAGKDHVRPEAFYRKKTVSRKSRMYPPFISWSWLQTSTEA
jgi:hypothetical protein